MAGGLLLGLSVLSLCLFAPQTTPGGSSGRNSAASAPPEISWHIRGEMVLSFEYFNQHIYVPVSLNGKSGYTFMLDSGANRNILNLRVTGQLGSKPRRLAAEKSIGFGDGRIYVAPEENVNAAIGSVPLTRVMSIMDLNRFEQHFSHATDGMLGYPFFRHYVVKLDFRTKLLTIFPPENYRYRGLGIQVPLRPSKDFVVIPVKITDPKGIRHPIDAVVDSGSNMTFILYRPYVGALKLQSSFDHATPRQGYGLNGYYPYFLGSINSLEIGNAEARSLPVAYLDKEQQLAAVRNIPGAIGNGILQSFQVVIFDVPHQRMIFELKPPLWQPGVERTATVQ